MRTPTHEADPAKLAEARSVAIVFFFIFFLLGYSSAKYFNKRKKNDEYGARVVSLIHAICATTYTGYAMLEHEGGSWLTPATRMEAYACAFSLAYFCADSVLMCLPGFKFDWFYLVHHIAPISCCLSVIVWREAHWAYCVCYALVWCEFSNIFMHSRWLARNDIEAASNSGNSSAAFYQRIILSSMTRAFFVAMTLRCLAGAPLVWHMVPGMPLYFAPLSLGIFFGSIHFLYVVAKAEWRGEYWEG